ncbi:DUF6624 domain-containing protein [Streptomyces sp. NPDC006140]|uniref:DUF6624 domain-containing protein n=1 Tax=Streptomyces sp. NPDC006140 TaxID=3154579 RepID=UPI0033D44B62
MTTQPQRPDLARELLSRAQRATTHRSKLLRGLLSRSEIDMGCHIDHADAQVLRRIVAEHGWPGRSLVGEEGAEAAWQLALHADHLPDFQRAALRMLANAVERGEAPIRQWAHLRDRCAINAGQPQIYGTQHRRGLPGVEMLPTQDPENLDARRASVGLPPHAAVHEALRQRHHREPKTEQSGRDGEPTRAALLRSAA